MPYANLLYEVEESVALVTVNRPEKLNPLNIETIDALEACFRDIAADEAVKAVILTGAGDKSFVAGADINQVSGLSAIEGRDWGLRGQQVFSQIENLPKPVIAAINGYALGGGLELAMACHIRIASENAKLGQPEVKLGIVPGYGGTQRLPRLVGKGRALEMILTGDPIPADEACRIGLVNRVVPGDQLLSTARELAARIIRNGPVAVALCLQAVQRGMEMPLDAALQWEASQFGLSCATEDIREGTRAFLEKRKAEFKGR
ncbi:MAG: enoyl-CoA hydratase-related protein [Bryobacterales bacterium]